ncbi:MAG: hypothetical protein WA364_30600 [Candidatus Nitrosopolaris sp.]
MTSSLEDIKIRRLQALTGERSLTLVLPKQSTLLDNMQLLKLEAKIDSLSEGYMSDENKEVA